MKRSIILVVIAAVVIGAGFYYVRGGGTSEAAAGGGAQGGQRGGGGGFPGGGGGFGGPGFGGPGGFGPRMPMTVELAAVKRADMSSEITVVGNLIGADTVEAVAKINGRLDDVFVRMGDQVKKGQQIAKVEDRELQEQIKQAQAIVKQRGFYSGEETGKLDADTREGLKKYQTAENLKVTGTLNKVTLEKMGIALTDKQKSM